MGASQLVATTPGTLVTVPSSYTLHYRITVTNAAASLVSLLPNGVLPSIPANPANPARILDFGFVDLQVEDPTVPIRETEDGQTAPTATLGFVVAGAPARTRIPVHPSKINLISTGANVFVQVYLGVCGTAAVS